MTQKELKSILNNHIRRIEAVIEKRKKVNSIYSKIRLGYFIVAILTIYLSYGLFPDWAYLSSLIAWIGGFIFLIDRHRRVYQSQEKFEYLRDIKREHIARMELDWQNISYRSLTLDTRNHPFANDLDILGKHSLFHLIDTSIYEGSAKKLSEWLLTPSPKKEEVLKRQKKVMELAPLSGFRDKLRVISSFTSAHSVKKNWSTEDMLTWLRLPQKKGLKVPFITLSILSALNIIFAVLLFLGILNPLPLVISLVTYLVCYKFNDHKIADLFDACYQIEIMLNQLSAILYHVEDFKPRKGSELESLLEEYQSVNKRPSLFIKKTLGMLSRASLRANEVFHFIINFIMPWDYFYAIRVEQLKKNLEPKLTKWLDTFYELEALNSLANFAMLNPDYTYPDFKNQNDQLFFASKMGHPLIPVHQRVANSFEVKEGKDLFLITGSNMSGKSTFLRTVGINLILAYSGAPVCAEILQTKFYRVFSSINITDSLDDGLSHFYTEVKRLRYLLDELLKEDQKPLFFFVDEIYRGTNNRERFTGSAAFLKEVAGKNGIGLVSSHDLELADLESEITELSNWHFVESIKDEKMSFEYKIKPGPCPSTNALEIMRMEGLPT